ncbi:hypothetical protein SAMN05444358_101199 [Ruegeria halocynthiae]|uniref:Uncharacterized protein n=1 Tax=Ruegeria halocynthiae TaxID=985054 RepID=A0A1H2RKQ8_9RHOB|nr:hypothetical protein [Ruegeria halocynthiae]SDW20063.1 hypothetical protein SAMN05444358_101199 [Ruegeria halocynthiae]
MTQYCFISQTNAAAGRQIAAPKTRVKPEIKGGAMAADAVYTNAPTQPHYAQASGLSIARGKRNTHGVRTNG